MGVLDPSAIAKARDAGYSDAEILAHLEKDDGRIKQARSAGYDDGEILNYLAGPDTKNLRPNDAKGALDTAKADLERQIANLPPEAQKVGRERFEADPRIQKLEASVAPKRAARPQPKSTLEQLGDSAINTVAGAAQGLTSIPDLVTGNAVAPFMRTVASGGAKIGSAIYRGLGMDDAAVSVERNAATVDRGLAHPFTLGGEIEKIAPTPNDTSGKVARFGSQMLGGMLVPIGPKASVPAQFPKPAPQAVAKEVVDTGEREGVRVMTTDVKPPSTFLGKNARALAEKIPFLGTGGTRAAQQTERVEAVKNVLRDFGGDDANAVFSNAPTAVEDVAKQLTAQRGKELSRLTFSKNMVIDSTPGEVPVPNALRAIDEQITRLRGLNNKDVGPAIAKLENWKVALQGQGLRNIEENRKLMGAAFDEPGLAGVKDVGQKAVNAIYGPLREDMGNFIRTQAGELKFTRWKNANDRLAAMAGELKNTTLRNVLRSSEMTPENVGKLLFSHNRSDVARLYANLNMAGKARAQAAVLQRAYDGAISADGGLSVERFVTNMKGMGDSIGVVFTGADNARITGLARLLDATRRAAEATAMPPTGVQNAPAVAGYTLGALFGKAAVPFAAMGGMFARAYESAPVRNLLMQLGKAPEGSKQAALLANRAVGALAAFVEREMPAINDNIAGAASRSPVSGIAAEEQNQNVRREPVGR